MLRLTKDRIRCRTNRPLPSRRFRAGYVESLLLLLLAGTMMLPACGGRSGTSGAENAVTLSGNWQFTMTSQIANPPDPQFTGGLQGGFLLQQNGSVTGTAAYSVSVPQLLIPCNSGSAPITGTISGQNVTITEVAGTQTFTLTGTLSSDGSTMAGTYTSTAGTAADGSACGNAETGLQWSAVSVPPLTGAIQGSFHSTGGAAGLSNQDFPASGSLTQAENTGAGNATVTGTLNFIAPATNAGDYPCLFTASVYGQISGRSVTLQIVGADQSILGQIGEPAGSNGVTGVNPVTFDSAQGGYILHGIGPSYLVATKACPGSLGSTVTAGDYGNLCLAVGSTNACQQPVTLTPAALTFPAQTVGTTSTQTITLANTSGTTQTFYLTWTSSSLLSSNSDGSNPNFTALDNCAGGAPSLPATSGACSPLNPVQSCATGAPFSLDAGQSCAITVTAAPQEPGSLTATLTANSTGSPDNDTAFTVPITGTGVSADAVSTRAIDFGAEGVSDASLPQLPSFTNHSGHPARALPSSSNRTFQDVEHHAEID